MRFREALLCLAESLEEDAFLALHAHLAELRGASAQETRLAGLYFSAAFGLAIELIETPDMDEESAHAQIAEFVSLGTTHWLRSLDDFSRRAMHDRAPATSALALRATRTPSFSKAEVDVAALNDVIASIRAWIVSDSPASTSP
jgi:hypothetical protein